MRQTIGSAVVTLIALILASETGCSDSSRSDTEERLQRTLLECEEHGAPEEILDALRKATPKSLKRPHLVFVRISYAERPSQLKSLRFWFEWIEQEPTPDSVLFRNTRTGQETTFEIDEVYRSENAMLSRSTVLYRFCHTFDPDSDRARDFFSQVATGGAEALLLRNGEAVSNRVSVEAMSQSEWDRRSERGPVTRRVEEFAEDAMLGGLGE